MMHELDPMFGPVDIPFGVPDPTANDRIAKEVVSFLSKISMAETQRIVLSNRTREWKSRVDKIICRRIDQLAALNMQVLDELGLNRRDYDPLFRSTRFITCDWTVDANGFIVTTRFDTSDPDSYEYPSDMPFQFTQTDETIAQAMRLHYRAEQQRRNEDRQVEIMEELRKMDYEKAKLLREIQS